MSIKTAKDLLNAIKRYNKVKHGPSDDAEHDAGVELENTAVEHLRSEAAGSPELAPLVDEFNKTYDPNFDPFFDEGEDEDEDEFDEDEEDANDQPATCGECGSRTKFTTNPDGTERHKCLTCSHTWEQDELGYIIVPREN